MRDSANLAVAAAPQNRRAIFAGCRGIRRAEALGASVRSRLHPPDPTNIYTYDYLESVKKCKYA